MAAAACVALLLCTLLLAAPFPLLSPLQAGSLAAGATAVAAGRGGLRWALLVLLAALPVIRALGTAEHVLGERWAGAQDASDVLATGSVCQFVREQPGSWRFLLETDAASRARGLPSRILVSWYEDRARPASAPVPGERWQLDLRLRPPRGLSNPGGFDYERWLFAQRIGATGWVRDAGQTRRLAGTALGCPLAPWRADLAARIRSALGDRPATSYVLGLAIGAYQALSGEEWERLRRTGTTHLISISGFHIALVAAPAAVLGLLAGRAVLAVGRRCRPPVWAAWTAALVAAAYGLLAGFTVPTARSVVAVVSVALLVSSRRVLRPPELLGTVVLAVLLMEPLAPLVPGFWLSFAGVAVLAAVAREQGSGGAIRGALRLLVVTQLAMTVGLAPLVTLFFGQLPLAGAVANLVAVPAFSVLLLPLTLLGTVLITFSPELGGMVLGLAAWCFDLWRSFLASCAELPLAVWPLPAPGVVAALLACAGAVVLLWPPPWPARWLGLVMLAGLLGAASPPVPQGGLRVTVLDVGQGLAVLVETAGHALLYDTGPASRGSDAGERVVVPVLQALGIKALDAVLVSHPDADHAGGLASVLDRHPEARVLGEVPRAGTAAACRAGLAWRWDGVHFAVLHPPGGSGSASDNERSCVLLVSAPGARLLLPGDIPAAVEVALVDQAGPGGVDLVVAAHHGSRTSSSRWFVTATSPRYVIFATGYRNRWRFPAPEVVARWQEAGACTLDTAEEGALQFVAAPDGPLRLVARERSRAPGVWLARPPRARPCG